jgi:hypothetical protein
MANIVERAENNAAGAPHRNSGLKLKSKQHMRAA